MLGARGLGQGFGDGSRSYCVDLPLEGRRRAVVVSQRVGICTAKWTLFQLWWEAQAPVTGKHTK
jgi:hypothetical protein